MSSGKFIDAEEAWEPYLLNFRFPVVDLQEGRQEGEAKLLLRMLPRRFGPLPEEIAERYLFTIRNRLRRLTLCKDLAYSKIVISLKCPGRWDSFREL